MALLTTPVPIGAVLKSSYRKELHVGAWLGWKLTIEDKVTGQLKFNDASRQEKLIRLMNSCHFAFPSRGNSVSSLWGNRACALMQRWFMRSCRRNCVSTERSLRWTNGVTAGEIKLPVAIRWDYHSFGLKFKYLSRSGLFPKQHLDVCFVYQCRSHAQVTVPPIMF